MKAGWTIAIGLVAYHLGKNAGERSAMDTLKEIPPPGEPPEVVEVSQEEVDRIVDLVPDSNGVYTDPRELQRRAFKPSPLGARP